MIHVHVQVSLDVENSKSKYLVSINYLSFHKPLIVQNSPHGAKEIGICFHLDGGEGAKFDTIKT